MDWHAVVIAGAVALVPVCAARITQPRMPPVAALCPSWRSVACLLHLGRQNLPLPALEWHHALNTDEVSALRVDLGA